MTPEETVLLTRYCRALFPNQPFDEYTADAWHDVLGHRDLTDCRAAAVTVQARQPFISAGEIETEVRKVREGRLGAAVEPPPDTDPDDVPGWLARRRDNIHAIAAGHQAPHQLPTGTRALPVGEGGLPDVTGLCPTKKPPTSGSIPPVRPDRDQRRRVLAVECPACGVEQGRMCVVQLGGKTEPRQTPHPSRELIAGVRPPADDEDRRILAEHQGGAA